MKEQSFRRIPSVLFLLWSAIAACILGIYIFRTLPLKYLVFHLRPVAEAGLYLLSVFGVGSLCSRFYPKMTPPMFFLTSASLGFGLTSLLALFLGLLGILHPLIFACWIALGLIAGILQMLQSRQTVPLPRPHFWDVIGGMILAGIILFQFPYFLTPEVSSDARSYHLLLPQLYLAAGKVFQIPSVMESNYPQLVEMNYLVLLMVSNEIACKLLHFFTGMLVALAMLQLYKNLGGPGRGWLAPAAFIAMPAVMNQLGWAWNDFFFTLLVLLTLNQMVKYQSSLKRDRADLVLAGTFAGLAASTKYTVLLFFPVLCILLWYAIRKRNWDRRTIASVMIPMMLLWAPWLIKNWIYTGNPLFPFLNGMFQSPQWNPSLNSYFDAMIGRFYSPERGLAGFLSFPFHFFIEPSWIDTHPGILPVLLIPLLFLGHTSDGSRILRLYLFCTVLLWIILQTGIRTVYPAFAVFFCLTAVPLAQIKVDSWWKQAIAAAIFTGSLVSSLITGMVNTQFLFSGFAYSVGLEDERQFLIRTSSTERVYDYLNRTVTSGKVLLVSMHDPLHLIPPAFFSGRFNQPVAETIIRNGGSVSGCAELLRKLEISQIAIDHRAYRIENQEKLYNWSSQQKQVFEELLATHFRTAQEFENEQILVWK